LVVDQAKSLELVGQLVVGAAGIAIAYLFGGLVMAVRLTKVGMPVEQGLTLIPREQILLVGIRELLIAGAIGVFFLFLAGRRWRWILMVAAVLLLLAPLTVGGTIWAGLLVTLAFVTQLIAARSSDSAGIWILVVSGIMLLIACALRYQDPPFRFPVGQIVTEQSTVDECGPLAEHKRICGAFLGFTSDDIRIGSPARDFFAVVSRDKVERIYIAPPPETSPPRRSLIARLTDSQFSATPTLDFWINGHDLSPRLLR
jgi:hypothetical protein